MNWLERFLLPWRITSDLQRDMAQGLVLLLDIQARTKRMEDKMAADRELLAQLAEGLTTLATPVQDVIDKLTAANAKIAELEGQAAADEVADLSAIAPVKDAFDALAAKFRDEPEAPDVEPLPEPEPEA